MSLAAHSSAGLRSACAPRRRARRPRMDSSWLRCCGSWAGWRRSPDLRGLRGQRGRRPVGRPRPVAGRSLDVGRGRIDRLLSRRGRTGHAAEQRHVHVPTGRARHRGLVRVGGRAHRSQHRAEGRCWPACSGGLARRRTTPSITPTGSRAGASRQTWRSRAGTRKSPPIAPPGSLMSRASAPFTQRAGALAGARHSAGVGRARAALTSPCSAACPPST